MEIDDDEGQIRLFPHRVENLASLPGPTPGVNHHRPLQADHQPGIQQLTLRDQHVVIAPRPSQSGSSIPPADEDTV